MSTRTKHPEVCPWCAEGYRVDLWEAYDGFGKRRMHEVWDDDSDMYPSSYYCEYQGNWFYRHPLVTCIIIFWLAGAGVLAWNIYNTFF